MPALTTPSHPARADALLTVGDLLAQLGGISPERVRLQPPPGTATEQDAIANNEGKIRMLCELVDGVLVEKTVGYLESMLGVVLSFRIMTFLEGKDLGIVLGADGMVRLFPGNIREPDVSFISWSRFPNRVLPPGAVLNLAPDLAVEILSAGNTAAEMDRKRQEYFAAGTRLVWMVDPKARTVRVYTSPEQSVTLDESMVLEGGAVLPGFGLPVREMFERASRMPGH